MSDQGHWFKLWCSALDDADLDNLDICDFGRWAKFGAYLKQHGNDGAVVITSPARTLCAILQVSTFSELLETVNRFPNVAIEEKSGSEAEQRTVNISFSNWKKYQSDNSGKTKGGLVKVGGVWRSKAEHDFAKILDSIPISYKQQQRFPHAKTFYTVDFLLEEQKLAFEINGPEHGTHRYKELDTRKKVNLSRVFGITVVAISSDSIANNPDFTKKYVIECIESQSNTSSSIRREEKRREENVDITNVISTTSASQKKAAAPSQKEPQAVSNLPAEATECAEQLRQHVLSIPKASPPTEKQLHSWAEDFDRLHRLNGKSWDDIHTLLSWACADPFWRTNILSASKFREKWNMLAAKMSQVPARASPSPRNPTSYEVLTKLIAEREHDNGRRDAQDPDTIGPEFHRIKPTG